MCAKCALCIIPLLKGMPSNASLIICEVYYKFQVCWDCIKASQQVCFGEMIYGKGNDTIFL